MARWKAAASAVVLLMATTAADAGYRPTALLQALDKVTGRVFTIEAPINQDAYFGNLMIRPWKCFRAPPEEPPENAAFLRIVERKQGEDDVELFRGWMFASSPGLSAMEHPVYDVVVLDCLGEEIEPEGEGDGPVAADTISPAAESSNE